MPTAVNYIVLHFHITHIMRAWQWEHAKTVSSVENLAPCTYQNSFFIVQSFWWANVVLKLFTFKKTTFDYQKHINNFMENCPFMGYGITNGTKSLFKNQTILQKCADQLTSWQPLYIHQTCTVPGIKDDFNCDKCQYS